MAYPPQNLNEPAMQTHLHVGLVKISLEAFKNYLRGGGFTTTFIVSSAFLTSKNPLFGS